MFRLISRNLSKRRRDLLVVASAFGLLASGASVRADNTVLVADTFSDQVLRYNVNAVDNTWSLVGVFASTGDGSGLTRPMGITYDGAGSVYVSEGTNTLARILKYDLTGAYQGTVTTFGGQLADDLIMAPDGNLLASNPFGDSLFATTDNIVKINVSTGVVQEFIAPGDPLFGSPYQLSNPRGLAINGNTLYVANRDAMGTSTGSILRFDANTGAYLDANIGADGGSINDDVYGNFDNPQALHFDASTNRLFASVFGGGQDIFEIDVTAATPPIQPANGPGVTKVYNPSDTGGILDIKVVNGVTYWTSFNNNAIYRLDGVDLKTAVATGLSNPGHMTEIPFQPGTPIASNWVLDAAGNWLTASNWSISGVPNSNAASAVFGSAITADRTVYADSDVRVNSITFDNANSYAIAGHGTLTLAASAGDASIDVLQGSHELQVEVELEADLDVNVAAGAALAFNNVLRLNGNTLTNTGAGTAAINNQLILDGGALAVTAGSAFALNSSDNQLDGSLALLAESSLLANGATFDLLDFNALGDEFDEVLLPALAAGLQWDSSQLYVSGVVAVIPEPAAGVLAIIVVASGAAASRRRS